MRNIEFPKDATTIHDFSDLIIPWIRHLQDLNREEAENISNAYMKYLRPPVPDPAKWFQIKELMKIHHTMFCNVWKWAGTFRKSVTNIGIPPHLIPAHLSELCVEVSAWSLEAVELTFLERAARIHHRLAKIHPFENGNGRFARFIADRFLLANRCSHPFWPSGLGDAGESRQRYILSLKAADKGDYDPLIELMMLFHAKEPLATEILQSEFFHKRFRLEQLQAILKAKESMRKAQVALYTT